jgi:hypothetical protein
MANPSPQENPFARKFKTSAENSKRQLTNENVSWKLKSSFDDSKRQLKIRNVS